MVLKSDTKEGRTAVEPIAVFVLQFAWFLLAWSLIAYWVIWPWSA